MIVEQWKPVKGYEGLYEVSNLGRVKSLDRIRKQAFNTTAPIKGKVLKQFIQKNGYVYVGLSKNGKAKTYSIHSIVWDAFGEKPRNGRILQVDHIDDNKTNNRTDNLQLLSHRENNVKVYKQKNRELPTGVSVTKNNKYKSEIRTNNIRSYIGQFDTLEEASKAYQQKLREVTSGVS